MSLLNAQSGFHSNFTNEECSRDDEEAEEVYMAINCYGGVCGIAFSSPNGILKCVPDFQFNQEFTEVFTIILEVNPYLILGTEYTIGSLKDFTSTHGYYDSCLQRLHLIKLPYAPTFVDEGESAAYIMSILPKDSPQMIRAAGALLDYLAKRTSPVENFPFPSVGNVLDVQLYLRQELSNFKSPDYLNTCSSNLGSRLLSKWLRFPLQDMEELHRRQHAIEFLSKSANRSLHKTLISSTKRVGNIQRVLGKMHTSSASPNDWKILLQTLQSLKEILSVCYPHPELGTPFETPESVQSPQQVINSLLDKVAETIDMSSTSNHKRFIVRQGHHAWLDEWKQIYRCLPDILSRLAEHELNRLRGHVDACGLIYFPLVSSSS
ncbi:unnamed protein product [Rodentolepis nana]|uniref:MUTSd domain-containing protein n=1 Tax=Rodentolepis nana TaxID=102285 RepID=A0A0R3TEB9_RODNA|nr:unnamed protein product [Rodentolepis nana]